MAETHDPLPKAHPCDVVRNAQAKEKAATHAAESFWCALPPKLAESCRACPKVGFALQEAFRFSNPSLPTCARLRPLGPKPARLPRAWVLHQAGQCPP